MFALAGRPAAPARVLLALVAGASGAPWSVHALLGSSFKFYCRAHSRGAPDAVDAAPIEYLGQIYFE